MVFVAELVVDHHQPLGVVGERQLPGHADAAVQRYIALGKEQRE